MKRREFVKTMTAAGAGLMLEAGRLRALHAQAMKPEIRDVKPDESVRRVLVMFKCHFDAGFIDTQYNVVYGRYFEKFFPEAIELAKAQNAGGKRRYVWTTGSWLVYEYLDWTQPAQRKAMEDAIARGDIAWHALPFNWQTEMMDRSMIEGSLAISELLDKRFGKKTTGAKMTDVPGHTRGIIPPLAAHGVDFLEIGVNGGSTPAEVPSLFLWKDPSGASLPMMYHHEYGGVAVVPGADLALVTEVRGDNSGPHKPEEIDEIYAELAARFPKAEITASNLSEMAEALDPHRDKLPVVTQEIGDTWIYGCASDPLKVARYRAVARLREQWIAQGKMQSGDATDVTLLRHVLLEPEHTWGTDTKTWLDFENYTPADLNRMLGTKNYKVVEFSWIEKRQDLMEGVAALPEAMREEAQLEISSMDPAWPVASPNATMQAAEQPIETEHFVLGIDAKNGAITQLRSKSTGREWASAANPIALLTYQTLSQEDYRRFIASYIITKADWAQKDFGKPNIEKFGARSEEWHPGRVATQVEETADTHRVLVSLQFDDEEAFKSGRASFPRQAWLELTLPKSEPAMHIALSWFGKPATRLPEALWLTFNPKVDDVKAWKLDKSGEWISPFDVVESGNRHMHAVQKGFTNEEGGNSLSVDTLDAPVVALGERTPLLFSNDQPDLSKGIHSCLFNNAWGTNYIMWYGENGRARFVLRA
ncbi:MAG TPA: DUF5054 domain-containing protein [Terracidiphilus sp.]|nr:DUF5054 domain-containing protein [Terracidiphilus sp.]